MNIVAANHSAVHPVNYSMLEALTSLRYMRSIREGFRTDITLLQQKFATHGNGHTQGAILALDAEIAILDAIIAKLWASIT